MAKEIPSVGDLRRNSEVTDDQIVAVLDAYRKDENAKPFAFKSGHWIDVAKAILIRLCTEFAEVALHDAVGLGGEGL
ncbi:hypothetical protein MKK63_16805 [Methylobacterium sp. J-088]|uniref:hypothetical protein n=1 Tax=Methylobacterium sp. J-088 TaxID=2836664 RepID=UPI001FB88F70|nr:hypothetical protein [Methylobacterium sp. J-088]MCJ2064361.1 hypothetical protein [Methylobacterium sp. J-088]